uniref:Uncharacterized protein n=1 Tax=Aegilops tauschii TaxID=37682 RepID=R7WBA6_AEGTA
MTSVSTKSPQPDGGGKPQSLGGSGRLRSIHVSLSISLSLRPYYASGSGLVADRHERHAPATRRRRHAQIGKEAPRSLRRRLTMDCSALPAMLGATGNPAVHDSLGPGKTAATAEQVSVEERVRKLLGIGIRMSIFDRDYEERENMLFACSGTALPRGRERLCIARFVTSARLITEFNKRRNKDDSLRIQVRLPSDRITDGFLGLYDDNIAIVSALLIPCVYVPVDLDLSKEERQCVPTRMIAAGLAAPRKSSPGLMVTGVSTLSSPRKRPRRGPALMSIACVITEVRCGTIYVCTEAALGGPVIAFCAKFEILAGVIIGFDSEKKVASYLPTKALRRRLKHFQILTDKAISFHGYSLPHGVNCVVPSGFWFLIQRFKSLGYPPPPPLVCEFNGTLVNTFEEDFGRLLGYEGYPFSIGQRGHGENVWAKLPKEVVWDVSRSVVLLASFRGEVRFFACTGLLIKWHGSKGDQTVILTSASLVRTNGDKIDEDLRVCAPNLFSLSFKIEVFLPPELKIGGRLELYHENYNIAIVSVESPLNGISPNDILRPLGKPKSHEVVVAIGRNPNEGLLMASKDEVEHRYKRCKLKCKALKLSSCRIKKAGIGGPLIDFDDGNFVGMNFYDGSTTTPFLPRSTILRVLNSGVDLPSNRWPVPETYWYHGELEMDKSVLPPHVGRVPQ